jgi:branched-chain amino acid transport system substrate-binding protein
VIYGGACPNQNSVPLANYLMAKYGKRIFFVGSDYIYPRESNRVMRNVLRQGGGTVVGERYFNPTTVAEGFADVLAEIMETRPDAIFSTIVGQSCIEFYRAYHAAGGDGRICPIASLTTNEGEISAISPAEAVGHVTAAPYFRSINSTASAAISIRHGQFRNHSRKGSISSSLTLPISRLPSSKHSLAKGNGRSRSSRSSATRIHRSLN